MEISLETLVQYFEDSADASIDARTTSEKCRDYYDGIQLTAAEVSEYKRRKQPPTVFNRIQPKIDFLIGMEQQTRTDPKAYPRTPEHDEAADAATDSIRYVLDNNDFNRTASAVFDNFLVEGTGGVAVEVDPESLDIVIRQIPWDRYFIDPHSRRKDHLDARYDGVIIWMDFAEAKERWADRAEQLDIQMEHQSSNDSFIFLGDTYEDKPSDRRWFDSKRNRIMVVEINYIQDGEWYRAVFTQNVELEDRKPITYLDDANKPFNNFIMESALIDREGNRYGVVKNLLDIQDEINKRRSKSLHILNTRQTFSKAGMLENINQFKREANKPDGHLEFPVQGNFGSDFGIIPDAGLAASQFQMYQESVQQMDSVSANAALAGKTAEGTSGRAIQSLQQGGMIELGPRFDTHSHWKKRVYRAVWNMIKQFWTADKWIRVTDDEDNLKWVGLNQPVTLAEQMVMDKTNMGLDEVKSTYGNELLLVKQQRPDLAQLVDTKNNVAEIDVDIILEEVPDVVNLQSEQFDLLVKMYQANPSAIPWEKVIKMSSLRNKDAILGKDDDEKNMLLQQQAQLQQMLAELEMGKTQSEIEKNQAQTAKTTQEATQKQIENALIMSNPAAVNVAI